MEMMERAYQAQMPFQDMQMPYYLLIEVFEQSEGKSENELYSFIENVSHLIDVSFEMSLELY